MTSNCREKEKGPKSKKVSVRPFSHDIVLLAGLEDKEIPHQGSKVFGKKIDLSVLLSLE